MTEHIEGLAAEFPQLCEAETDAFARLLGVHVQRLATLAGGEHVCTTYVPGAGANPQLDPTPEGARNDRSDPPERSPDLPMSSRISDPPPAPQTSLRTDSEERTPR